MIIRIACTLFFLSFFLSQISMADDEDDVSYFGKKSNGTYKSYIGNRYQYDLSNPVDEMKYEMDIKAQIRDELDVNPMREIDRDLGQYGGGILND